MKRNWFGMPRSFFRYACISGTAAVFVCGLFSCSGVPTTGSGTGVGNGMIVGHVMYANGTHPKNASVRLRLKDFLPDTSGKPVVGRTSTVANVYTDSEGSFLINALDPRQTYSIEVNDGKNQEQATLFKCNFSLQDTIILMPRNLEPVIPIDGEILIAGLPRNAYILVYGLEVVGRSDALGRFTITNLPAGKCEEGECEYKMRVIVPLADGTTKTVEYEFEIKRDVNGNVILPVELEISD